MKTKCNYKLVGSFLIKGQSLFEVLFTIAVAALVITGVVSLASTSVNNSSSSRNKTLATKYAEELLSWIRSERDTGWNTFILNLNSSQQSLTFCFDNLLWNMNSCASGDYIPGTQFTRQAVVSCFNLTTSVSCNNSGVNRVRVEVSVGWNDGKGNHTAASDTELYNWDR